jgi:cytidylate kinase
VVNDACEEGPAVLVGRAAVALLSRREDALHVRLIAPLSHRIRVVAERFGISDDEAGRRIKATDANRDRYHRQWYNRDWRDPVNYHLTCNTGRLGLERTADLIVSLAEPLLPPSRA